MRDVLVGPNKGDSSQVFQKLDHLPGVLHAYFHIQRHFVAGLICGRRT